MVCHKFIGSIIRARCTVLVLCALGLSGCAVVGPQSITAGRGAYTDVINQTEDEQILNVLVRQRYDQTFGMISVASITANLQFSARADANIGIGDSDNYEGNLVPLAAGVGYEENPTIAYVPLSGEDFMRRMLTPVSASEWAILTQYGHLSGNVVILAARRVNGLHNELLRDEPTSPKFLRFVDLLEQLRMAGVLDVVQASDTGGRDNYVWDIRDYQDGHRDSVREFLDLIGIQAKLDGSAIRLPLLDAVGSSVSAVHVKTRSAYSVLRVIGSGIEIPPAHLEAGIVEPLKSGLPEDRRIITIHSSRARPDNATVRIRFRDWWFYIDASDTQSKRAFMLLRTFIGMRLADPVAAHKAPVITIPVK